MLANGALAIENEIISKRLITMSTSIIPSIFCECDIFTVYGYFLMSYYFMKIGNISQAWFCIELTKGLLDIAIIKAPRNFNVRILKIFGSFSFEKTFHTL